MISKTLTANMWMHWPTPLLELTLYAKTATGDSGDTFATGVTCTTCRETPVGKGTAMMLGLDLSESYTSYQVWDRGQSRYPKVGDVLDNAGVRWRVINVRIMVFGNLYVCTCQKEIASS